MITDYCVACSNKNSLHNHHLVPRSRGGSDDETNLITLCGACHSRIHGMGGLWAESTHLITKAMQLKKSRGGLVGAVPYGKELATDGVTLVDNAAEQSVIHEARRLRGAGLSLRKIASVMGASGVVARNGKRFAATQIQRMVNA